MQPASHRHRPVALAALSVAVLTAGLLACGSGNGSGSACDPVRHEALDRRSLQHVLPGGDEPDYLTDPPTSGPHQPTPPVAPLSRRALGRPVQVGVLETGAVLVQHRGLSPADRRRVESLAGPRLVVAPATGTLGGAHVVATAWLAKVSCSAVDLDELRRFARTSEGKGPGTP